MIERCSPVLGFVHSSGAPAASFTLTFRTAIPSKKNALVPRRGRGTGKVYRPEVKAAMQQLEAQAALQWGRRRPLEHPDVEYWLSCHNEAQDRDGMETTLLDALKKAGVITDDSVRFFNGEKLSHQVEIVSRTAVPVSTIRLIVPLDQTK